MSGCYGAELTLTCGMWGSLRPPAVTWGCRLGAKLLGRIVAIACAMVLVSTTPAYAIQYFVLGRQNALTHSGVGGNVWAYPWTVAVNTQGAAHVSSFYVNNDGYSPGFVSWNYIEAGLRRDPFTGPLTETRAQAFYAYEDDLTSGQEDLNFGYVSSNAWHSVKIANYQPYSPGQTDWCVYIDGVIKKDGLTDHRPLFYTGQATTSSERGLINDSNLSSFDNVYNRFPNNSTGLWTSIKFEDQDIGYKPLQVDGSAWRCIVGP